MMIKTIKKKMANGYDLENNPFLYRRLVLTLSLLLITLVSFIVFIFINFTIGKHVLALIDFVVTINVIVALYLLIEKNKLDLAASFMTGLLLLFLIGFNYVSKNNQFELIWTLTFPLFVIPIMGIKKGISIIVFYYIILIPVVYSGIGVWNHGFWDVTSFIRFLIVSIASVVTGYYFESSSMRAYNAVLRVREKEKTYLKKLENLSMTDELTGLNNRRYFDDHFRIEQEKVNRYDNSLCLIMIDIDHFKTINDEFGHTVGDNVLIEFSDLLRSQVRETDFLSRWGGEEFMLLLPEIGISKAKIIAEKLRRLISSHQFSHNKKLTASFGVAWVSPNQESKRSSIHNVDSALYQAKNEGRNRVKVFEENK